MLNRGAGRIKKRPGAAAVHLHFGVFLAGRRGCALPPFLSAAGRGDQFAAEEVPSALCAPNGRYPTPAKFAGDPSGRSTMGPCS